MKFLKRFNEDVYNDPDITIWNNEMAEDVRDILLELQDEGFHIDQFGDEVWIKKENLTVSELISKGRGFFYSNPAYSVKEVMDRIKDYLGGNLSWVKARESDRWIFADEPENLTESSWFYCIKFKFTTDKLNESFEPEILIDNLYDICLELQDEGYEIFVMNDQRERGHAHRGVLWIKYKPGNGEFNYSDIKEVVDRLKDYLGDRFISAESEAHWKWKFLSSSDSTTDPLRGVKINFNW